MQIKRFLALIMAAVLAFSLGGCGNRGEDEPAPETEVTEKDELVLYHQSTAIAPMLMSIAEEYSSATGKKITPKLAGNDFLGEMKNSGGAVYIVDTHSDLSVWHSEGMFADFMNDSGLSSLFGGIPAGIQLNKEGIGSYGIPLMLEGYGLIVDKTMLRDLFGEESEELLEKLKTCSFTEFEGFAAAAETYISAPSAAKITIGGKEFSFLPEKTGKAKNLTGVFSLNNESTRAAEHLLSAALGAKFSSRYEVMTAGEEAISGMEKVFSAYAKALDFMTSHISGAEGSIGRGEEFTGGDYNYSTAIDLFTRGNALFYAGGTSDAADFEKSSEGFSENLDIIPLKLPIAEEDITAAGMTAEKLQSSIIIGSRYYLTLNPKASEELSAEARDFINWLSNDEAGKAAYSKAFGTVPHNFEYLMTEENENSGNSGNTENPAGEIPAPEGKTSSKSESTEDKTENGTLSSENEEQSPEESKPSDGENPGNGENAPTFGEGNPSHRIENSLMASLGEYYAKGNWLPDMTFALPADFAEKILGNSLSDYWGMADWSEKDRRNFVDTIIGGWKERLDKDKTAVG
ncbi:MAG: extracellular solute-binding protein [Oscillospiraceae bacterium]|nr:extracellular solute-binding protein [Oscillospiraceae bacterium]